MKNLTDLPNIGNTLAEKLKNIGINNTLELKQIGSKNAIIKIATIENSGLYKYVICLRRRNSRNTMAWLTKERKGELKEFYKMMN